MKAASERAIVRGCFLFGAVVLVLSVVFSSSFVHVASASASVNSHSMAIGINPDGTPISARMWPGAPWPYFWTKDEEAYVWMDITLDERMNITAQWCFPNGSIYQVDEKTCDEGSQYVWFSISIKDHPPAQVPRVWEVKVFADDTSLFTKEFDIDQMPTFPWTTNLTIAGVVVTAIAAPILVVFSKRKRPTPKLSFVLSLVGGLMVAISGFFRGALGGSMYILSSGAAVVIIFFYIIIALFLGTAISISALSRKGVAALVLSVFSLFYFMYIYYMLMSDDPRLYILPLILAVAGSVSSILGGLLIRRKT